THLHRDGTLRYEPTALAVRVETLVITTYGAVVRPPRRLALALAAHLRGLQAPPFVAPTDGPAARGAAPFRIPSARCHAAPGYSGPPVPLEVIGTDPRVGRSAQRGTGGYRTPSLRGVATRGPLFHDASMPSLEALFDPARPLAGGHAYGLGLDDD